MPLIAGRGVSEAEMRQRLGAAVVFCPGENTPRQPACLVPFARPVPDRRVVLVYRKTFPRLQAIDALRSAVLACSLNGVTLLGG